MTEHSSEENKDIRGIILSGTAFNKYTKTPFYKIIRKSRQHAGMIYELGINQDILDFNPHGENNPGGIYFTDKENIMDFMCSSYGDCICEISIPDDALVYTEYRKYKANKINIHTICHISESKLWSDHDFCLNAVKRNSELLQYAKNPTEQIYIEAVKKDSFLLNLIPASKQTSAICLAAVQQNGLSLQFMDDKYRTLEILQKAVEQNGLAIQFIKDPTDHLSETAVRQTGEALRFIQNQTPTICLLAVSNDGLSLRFCKNQTPDICKKAISQNRYALDYVLDQTEDICINAVKQNGYSIIYVHKQTPLICSYAIRENPFVLWYVDHQTPELCLEAARQTLDVLPYIDYQYINYVKSNL